MKNIFAPFLFISIVSAQHQLYAQAPSIEWQKCLGGSEYDVPHCIRQTADSGFIVVGLSESNDGDISMHYGSGDCWIVKLDVNGSLMWEETFGGNNNDAATAVERTTDGGYIVAGGSNSTDVVGNHGGNDFLIIKLDPSGNLLWQRCFGGISDEYAESIQQTFDGGYIAAGNTGSNDGDVSGNHGASDVWIIKLDDAGNLVWQKCFGGSGGEIIYSYSKPGMAGISLEDYPLPMTVTYPVIMASWIIGS